MRIRYFIFLTAILFSFSCKGGEQSQQAIHDDAGTIETEPVYYTILIWYKDVAFLREFEQQAAPYFQTYGLQIEHAINELSGIEAEGKDHIATPDEIQLVSAKDGTALQKLFEDEAFTKLLPIREKGVKKMSIIAGQKKLATALSGSAQIFGMGLFYFHGTGEAGLRDFEQKAGPYFQEHGLRLSHLIPADVIMAGIGEDDIPKPDEVQFLSVESQEGLKCLVCRPGLSGPDPAAVRRNQSGELFPWEKGLLNEIITENGLDQVQPIFSALAN